MADQFQKKKHYGQNFLVNPAIPRRIAEESGITAEDGVIEIGPGFGVLTRELSAVAKKVVTIEIDEQLIPILADKLSDLDNVTVLQADIMQVDLYDLIAREFAGMRVCVCANLPYYITTPVIMKLLEEKHGFGSVTVMVQKEVATRLCASAGSPEYGAVTAAVNYYAAVNRLLVVKAGSFSPPPKVDSAVIRMVPYPVPPVDVSDQDLLFRVIRAAFAQRRKTLVNSLQSILKTNFTKDELCDILTRIGFNAAVRGEELAIADFAKLTDALGEDR